MTDIATLLERNLREIFGEGDDARRRKVAEEIMHDDAVFVEPRGVHSGRDEIVRVAGAIRAMHPTFRYTPTKEAEVLHDRAGRLKWIAGEPGKAPVYAGTDFIVARDGKIAAIYLFFDGEPDPTGAMQNGTGTLVLTMSSLRRHSPGTAHAGEAEVSVNRQQDSTIGIIRLR